jgi:hypothetical protein
MSERIWECKIGGPVQHLPEGSGGPMRRAVGEAFRRITGTEPEFCFSGWGGELTEGERAVVENRLPVRELTETGLKDRIAELETERDDLMLDNQASANINHDLRNDVDRLNAALAEAQRDAMTARNQRDELRLLLDKRPAMNAGLREAYAEWSASIYTLDWLDAIGKEDDR